MKVKKIKIPTTKIRIPLPKQKLKVKQSKKIYIRKKNEIYFE